MAADCINDEAEFNIYIYSMTKNINNKVDESTFRYKMRGYGYLLLKKQINIIMEP